MLVSVNNTCLQEEKIKSLFTADDGKTKAEILERIAECRVLWEKNFDIQSVALSL